MEYKEAYWYPAPEHTRFYRCWRPSESETSLVLIIHGYGEHGGRYEELARRLAAEGSAVYAPDLRGHGYSSGTRAYLPRAEEAAEEVCRFAEEILRPSSAAPLFLLGHSLGGGLALLCALFRRGLFHGLILSGAAARTGGSSSPLTKALARLTAALAPRLPLVPFDAAGVSRLEEEVRSYVEDPLVYTGRMRARTAAEILRLEKLLPPERLAGLELPVLLCHGGSDPIVPPESSEYLYRHLSSADTTHRVFPAAYHEVHHEPEREELFDLLSSWISRHRSGE